MHAHTTKTHTHAKLDSPCVRLFVCAGTIQVLSTHSVVGDIGDQWVMPNLTYYYPIGTYNTSNIEFLLIYQFPNGTAATPTNVQPAQCVEVYDPSTYTWGEECTPEMLPGCPDACQAPIYPEGSVLSHDVTAIVFPGEPPVGYSGEYSSPAGCLPTQRQLPPLPSPFNNPVNAHQVRSGTSGYPHRAPRLVPGQGQH